MKVLRIEQKRARRPCFYLICERMGAPIYLTVRPTRDMETSPLDAVKRGFYFRDTNCKYTGKK